MQYKIIENRQQMRRYEALSDIESKIDTMLKHDERQHPSKEEWPVISVKSDPGYKIINNLKVQQAGALIKRDLKLGNGRIVLYNLYLPENSRDPLNPSWTLVQAQSDKFQKLYIFYNQSTRQPVLRLDVNGTNTYVESENLQSIIYTTECTYRRGTTPINVTWNIMIDTLRTNTSFFDPIPPFNDIKSASLRDNMLTFILEKQQRQDMYTTHLFEITFEIPTMSQADFKASVEKP